MYIGLYVKYPLLLYDYYEIWFSRKISEESQISNLMKSRPVGAE